MLEPGPRAMSVSVRIDNVSGGRLTHSLCVENNVIAIAAGITNEYFAPFMAFDLN